MKILLMCVATGKYLEYSKRMFADAKQRFLKGHEVDFLVFTDGKDAPVDSVKTRVLPWPYGTMMRYETYLTEKNRMLKYDYVFAIDADMAIHEEIGDEILGPDITAVKHPGYYNKQPKFLPFDRNPDSYCYVGEALTYFAGGFIGGKTADFITMAESISYGINKDLAKGHMPKWHDESHLNRRLWQVPPRTILSPSYCWAENHGLTIANKIESLSKNHTEIRKNQNLSVFIASKDRPFFLQQLLNSFRHISIDLTVFYLATNEQYDIAYEKIKRECYWAKFIKQNSKGSMRGVFLDWLNTASDLVMVCPDDNICIGDIDTDSIKQTMEDQSIFGFTLRLHPGIRNTQATKHDFTIESNEPIVVYEPPKTDQSPFGYIWEMSSTFYRKKDLMSVVNAGDFSTINELESRGLRYFNYKTVRKMACFQYAPITNVFVSTNFDGSAWCVKNRVSDLDALTLWESNREIDIEKTFKKRDVDQTTHVLELLLTPEIRLTNKAVIVVTVRNSAKYIGLCLDSVLRQGYGDIGIIVVDDCSDDFTAEIARERLKNHNSSIVIRNTSRKYALKNVESAIEKYMDNDGQVVFLLDGDDELISVNAIGKMMSKHGAYDIVWSDYQQSNGGPSCSGPLEDKPVRRAKWCMSHLKSFKRGLYLGIDKSQFIDNDGDYFKVTWDQAIMLPMAESINRDKLLFFPEKLYYYRVHAMNDGASKIGHQEQVRVERLIRSRDSGNYITQKRKTLSVVISSYNQLDTLPIVLESFYYQSTPPDLVVIADDGSDDDTIEWYKENHLKYPFKVGLTMRKHDGFRLSSLNNMAMKLVKSDRVLFTNADVIHSPISTRSHLQTNGIGGGIIRSINIQASSSISYKNVRMFSEIQRIYFLNKGHRTNVGLIQDNNILGVWGGNFSVPVEAFNEIGGFTPKIGWGGEDFDLANRLKEKGYSINWLKNSIGYHLDHPQKDYHVQATLQKV